MGLLRKTTELLRLEPGSDAWVKQGAFVPAREGISPEELQPLLQTLLAEPSLEGAEAQRVLARLRDLSTNAGPFLTASEIQRSLLRFKFRDSEGHRLNPARAYELASKLHWEHLHRQVEAIEADSKPLGPTVFSTFLEEMVECLLRSDEPRKAAEIPVVLAEELLIKLMKPSVHALDYVVLAERSIGTALDCCRTWHSEQLEGASAEGIADADEETAESPNHRDSDPTLIDTGLINYLRELNEAFSRVSLELHELMFPIDTCRFIIDSTESDAEGLRLAYLEVFAGMAKKVGYAPLVALTFEALADALANDDPEKAKGFTRQAADLYEAEAEKEGRLHLAILVQRRLRSAGHLQRDSDAA